MQHIANVKHECGETGTVLVNDLDAFWRAEEIPRLVVDFGQGGESQQKLVPKCQLEVVSIGPVS